MIPRVAVRAASIGVITVGCVSGGGGDELATRTDSAGIEIVTNTGLDRPIEVSYVRDVQIGGEPSGPASFYQVGRSQLAVTPDGKIVVLDRQGSKVSVFSSDGAPLASFGREGDGPGEFRNPTSLAILEDGTVVVHEYQKRALQRFTLDGVLVDQRILTVPFSGAGIVGTPTGLLLLSQNAPRGDGELVRRVLHLSEADTVQLGPTVTSTVSFVTYESCRVRMTQPPLFESDLVWASNGLGTIVVSGPTYSVEVFEGTNLVAIVRRDLEPEAATEAVLARVLGDGQPWEIGGTECVIPPDEIIEQRGYDPTVPLVESLAIAPSGELWVKRRTIGSEERAIDIFAPDGEYIGTAPSDSPFPAGFLPDGRLLTIEKDSFDVERVILYSATIEGGR